MTFHEFINNASKLLLVINTIVFIISYKKTDRPLKYFIGYLILCVFIQLITSLLADLRQNNLYLSHFFFTGQFVFLSLFFSSIYNIKKLRTLTLISITAITLFYSIYFYTDSAAFKRWNVFEIVITSIPLLMYSLYFFIKKMEDQIERKYLYFNIGFFVYTLCSTLIFITGNIGTKTIKTYIWLVNTILYSAYQVFIFVEWYKNFKKPIHPIYKKTQQTSIETNF